MALFVGGTVQATAVVKDSTGTIIPGAQPDTWQSSAAGIVTVSQTGLITGVSVGTATVTAKLSSPSLTSNALSVVVSPTPASIVISLPPGA